MSLLTCTGFAKHSQSLDGKVVFLINVLKRKNLDIKALKRKNILLKSKVNGLMDFKSKCTCKLPLYSQLLKISGDSEYYTGVTNLSLFQNLGVSNRLYLLGNVVKVECYQKQSRKQIV